MNNDVTRCIQSLCGSIVIKVATDQAILDGKESDPGSRDDYPQVFAKTEAPQTHDKRNSTLNLSSISSLARFNLNKKHYFVLMNEQVSRRVKLLYTVSLWKMRLM